MPEPSLIFIFVSSFVFAIGAVISPGPVSTAIVSQAPRRGWTVGPLVATGHSILELVLIILLALGLSTGLNNPSIQTGIAILGGLLLAWMGIGMLSSVFKGQIRVPGVSADVETLNSGQLVRLGIITTLSNPFWYAWWVTAVPTYLNQMNAVSPVSIGAFYLGHISADYAWDTVLSGAIAGGRRWITDNIYRGIIALCGAYFVYLGVVFLLEGLL